MEAHGSRGTCHDGHSLEAEGASGESTDDDKVGSRAGRVDEKLAHLDALNAHWYQQESCALLSMQWLLPHAYHACGIQDVAYPDFEATQSARFAASRGSGRLVWSAGSVSTYFTHDVWNHAGMLIY